MHCHEMTFSFFATVFLYGTLLIVTYYSSRKKSNNDNEKRPKFKNPKRTVMKLSEFKGSVFFHDRVPRIMLNILLSKH